MLSDQREQRLNREDDAFDVDVEQELKVFPGDGSQRGAVGDAGIGEQDIDSTKSYRRLVQSLQISWHSDVSGNIMSVRTELCCGGTKFGRAPTGDDYGGTLVDEELCRRESDTAATPGDYRGLVSEKAGAHVATPSVMSVPSCGGIAPPRR